MSKQVLGKSLSDLGLDVLLSEPSWRDDASQQLLSIHMIDPDSNQPRQVFDDDMLSQLTESIQRYGVLQPIVVTRHHERFRLVAGERRFRAALKAGLKKIPVVIRNLTAKEIKMIALVENIQREDLSPIEQANGMQRLVTEHELTHQLLAESVGTSRSQVSNLLRLLSLDPAVQDAISMKKIDMGHARCLVGLSSDAQQECLETIIKKNLTVRQVEALIKKPAVKKTKKQIESCKVKETGGWYQLKLDTPSEGLVDAIQDLILNWTK